MCGLVEKCGVSERVAGKVLPSLSLTSPRLSRIIRQAILPERKGEGGGDGGRMENGEGDRRKRVKTDQSEVKSAVNRNLFTSPD